MHLKRLTLSGFKTFANDTTLEFGPGITAIVGPNGSGKSNLVDAILWALGERSNKALRGHAATDVIFNGCADRKATNRAEVSLFFDNEDGALPLEFKEVQVSRRIFRDGDAGYAINKTNCRLRDVTDLFLDTGVGPESYSIISQSEIDAILSAKPEDRRALLEGAAGVQKYHARRNETRRKLDRVDADLTRVFDIMSELEGQLAPLAEQAELAREYHNYVARLRQLQLAVLARDYDTRTKRMQGLTESKEQFTLAVGGGQKQITEQEVSEAALEAKLRQLEDEVDTVQGEMTEAVSRLKSTEGQIAVARERRRALTEQQEFAAQEIGLLRARISSATEDTAARRAELEQSLRDSASLSDEAASAEARLGAANAQLSEATRELQARQAKVIELMRASQAQREAAATGRAQAEGLEHRLADLTRLLESLTHETGQLGQAQAAAATELAATQASVKAAEEAIAQKRALWEGAQKEQENCAARQSTAREQRSALHSRLGALRELEENLEGVQGGARGVLQAVKSGKLPEVYTLAAAAMRVPQELETAIEAALGAAAHNLICPHEDDAKRAIAWLKDQRAGRATFLPLPNLKPKGLNDATRQMAANNSGVRGVASELVSCSAQHQAAIDYLLGRVIVVENLDAAVQFAKRCDNGARLVTLEGELVLPSGAITGGQGKQKSSGLLARKRELEDGASRMAALEKELSTLQTALQTAQDNVKNAQAAWRAAQESGNESRSALARQEREVEHLQREARRVAQHLQATQNQCEQTRQQLQEKIARQDNAQKAADDFDRQAAALDEAVTQAQVVVTQRQHEREEISSSVADVRARHLATQERLAAMRRAIAELQKNTADFEAQIRTKQEGIGRAAGEDAALVTSEAKTVSDLTQLQQRREVLENAFATARTARHESLTALESLGASLKKARVDLHAAEEELHRVEVRIAQTEAEMADMQRRFTEEFEVSLDDALTQRDFIEQKQLALDEIEVLKDKISGLGNVNTGAIEQHENVKERLEFLTTQREDLMNSKAQLEEIIADIDGRTRERFMTTFEAVRKEFDVLFQRVFDGGSTELSLTDPDNLLETGVNLRVQPPGKAAQDISLLSGGERALTALSFMLALLKVHPSPFVVLDEVDAPLDQSNVGRFSELLREFTGQTQFIVITHNNGTMQAADVLYGVTMQQQGVSTLMSVRLVDEFETTPGRNGHANGGVRNGVAELAAA